MADDSLNSKQQPHEYFMRIAIEHAQSNPRRPYATVVVNNAGDIIVKSINNVVRSPTFHAEIVAINECAQRYQDLRWDKLTLYSTAEPCVMCQAAVYWAGIGHVVYGSDIPFLRNLFGLEINIRSHEVARQAPVRCQITADVLKEECNALFLYAQQLRKIDTNA